MKVEVWISQSSELVKFSSGWMVSIGNMMILEKSTPQRPRGLKQRVIHALLYCTGEMQQFQTHMQGKRPLQYRPFRSINDK